MQGEGTERDFADEPFTVPPSLFDEVTQIRARLGIPLWIKSRMLVG
jgi:hypothetical protein